MSECTFGFVQDRDSHATKVDTIGKPRLHPHPEFTNEARILDEDGRELPAGEVGEIVIRNAALMRGYLRRSGAHGGGPQGRLALHR
jgi:acyl-CoA synthetase (AMP-forming)/AMP-acid ligase II